MRQKNVWRTMPKDTDSKGSMLIIEIYSVDLPYRPPMFILIQHFLQYREDHCHVNDNRHARNMYAEDDASVLRLKAEKEAKENRQRKIDDQIKESREATKRSRPVIVERTAERAINDEIDFLVDRVGEVPITKRVLHFRPAN